MTHSNTSFLQQLLPSRAVTPGDMHMCTSLVLQRVSTNWIFCMCLVLLVSCVVQTRGAVLAALKFGRGNKSIVGMMSSEGEGFAFRSVVPVEGAVETWMTAVEAEMRRTLAAVMKEGACPRLCLACPPLYTTAPGGHAVGLDSAAKFSVVVEATCHVGTGWLHTS